MVFCVFSVRGEYTLFTSISEKQTQQTWEIFVRVGVNSIILSMEKASGALIRFSAMFLTLSASQHNFGVLSWLGVEQGVSVCALTQGDGEDVKWEAEIVVNEGGTFSEDFFILSALDDSCPLPSLLKVWVFSHFWGEFAASLESTQCDEIMIVALDKLSFEGSFAGKLEFFGAFCIFSSSEKVPPKFLSRHISESVDLTWRSLTVVSLTSAEVVVAVVSSALAVSLCSVLRSCALVEKRSSFLISMAKPEASRFSFTFAVNGKSFGG